MPGMPGMEMYSREDIEKMQDQFGGPNSQKKNEEAPKEEEYADTNYSTNLSFTDTVKTIAKNIFTWFKKVLGFSKKSEL